MFGQLITDSIGICLLNPNVLLTSVGNELLLHKSEALETSQLNATAPRACDQNGDIIRLSHKIHGIIAGDGENTNKILIYGEREFMLLSWSEINYQLKILQKAEISDWINAAVFLHDEPHFTLHTSHSVLVRFEYTDLTENPENLMVPLEIASCTDKSMLYGTHLHGTSWNELVVFSGNAFGELLIWQPASYQQKNVPVKSLTTHRRCPLLHRIAAHNGVIYSIDYNPHAKLLTTTSDDRSIKFWHVNDVKNNSDWSAVQVEAIVSGYGHTSRVFCGRIIEYDQKCYAITVGEDSCFCLWQADDGKMIFKRREQFGAIIWNFIYDILSQTIYTVGSTGNVFAYGLQSQLSPLTDQLQIKCELPELDDGLEYIAKVHFINSNMLIGVTNQNRFLYSSTFQVVDEENATEKWKVAGDHSPAYKCTVLAVNNSLVAFCGYKCITLYEFAPETESLTKCCYAEPFDGVIRSFIFLNGHTFLVSDEIGKCLLLKGKDMSTKIEIDLPKCKEPWLTSALLLPNGDFLLASNRQGNILLYERHSDDGVKYELKQKLLHPHGHLGATLLQLVDETATAVYIRSGGHDGSLKLLQLNKQNGDLKIVMKLPVPVAWVESIRTIRNNVDDHVDVVFGFNDNRFAAWSQENDILLQLPCGGGHRCWDFQLECDAKSAINYLNIVFIKQKRVTFYRIRLFNECQSRLLLPPPNKWHTNACNVLRVLTYKHNGKQKRLAVSAGEDNVVKINTINDSGQLQQQHELFTHTSSVRCLQLKRQGDDCLIFSGGGRAQLCISKVNLIDGKVQELSTFTLQCNNTDDNETVRAVGIYKLAAETRIMALAVAQVNGNEFCHNLYLGCSDGYLRLIRWSSASHDRSEQFNLLHALNIGCCILQIELIPGHVLLTGTNGVLYIFSNDLQICQLKLKLHENGINALDVLITNFSHEYDDVHILTGGDDQTVNYTRLCLLRTGSAVPSIKFLKSRKYKALHSAQVTAAALRVNDKTLEIYGYTGSLDQNIVVINLKRDCIENTFPTSVADIKGLCLSLPHRAILYGAGLQILQLY